MSIISIMKLILSFLTFVFIISAPVAHAFEGTYTMVFSQGRDKMPISIWTKDNHIRMEVQAKEAPGVMVMRGGMEKMLMIMPEQRMYMEMPTPKDMGDAAQNEAPKEGEMPFEKTGETKEILGYTAHEFVYEEGNERLVIWATEEIGSMPFARNPMMKGYADAMRKITGLSSFFPLEMTGYEKGSEKYKMAVTKVDAKELEDSLFEPPAGYMRMSMPGGMPGMFGR